MGRGFATLTQRIPGYLEGHVGRGGLALLPVMHRCPVSQTAASPGAWILGWTDPRGRLETQGALVSF